MADAFFVHEGKEYRVTKMAARTITRRGNDTRTVGAVWDLTVFPSEPGDTLNIDSLTMIEYGFRFPGSTIVHPYSGFVVSAYREFDSADLLIAVRLLVARPACLFI